MFKVLVTGGLGFIGSCVVRLLVDQQHSVVIFDNESTGDNYFEHELVTFIRGDVSVPSDFEKLPSDITHVIHLAAAISVAESMTDPEKYMGINVEGSKHVLSWALNNNVTKLASASSAAVYGATQQLPINESVPTEPISPYAESKLQMEYLHKSFNQQGLRCSCFRFFNVYGPRQKPSNPYSGVISKFMEMAFSGSPLTIFGDGLATRDFISVFDISNALITYLFSDVNDYDVYNVGTESVTSINDLARICIDITQSTSTIKYGPERDGDIKHSLSDSAKIRRVFGWSPKVKLFDGLSVTYKWFVGTIEDN
ncbi:hypothetical protein GEMRC1_009167 [Eukaryota sp. GEM-RC1]